MENLRGMKRNSGPFAFRVLIDDVAAALARDGKAKFFQDRADLAGSEAWKLGHQTETSTVERLTET